MIDASSGKGDHAKGKLDPCDGEVSQRSIIIIIIIIVILEGWAPRSAACLSRPVPWVWILSEARFGLTGESSREEPPPTLRYCFDCEVLELRHGAGSLHKLSVSDLPVREENAWLADFSSLAWTWPMRSFY